MRTVLFGVLSAAVAFSSPSPLISSQSPAAVLAGRVITGTGADARPVRRAKVTLSGPGLTAPRVTDTDTSGAYRFSGLPLGAFTVRVQKPGFVALDADAATGSTLTMTRGAAIEGVVSDAAGDPVWNAVVSALEPQADGKPKTIAQARTDDLGRYRLHSLPPGDYVVSAATDRDFIVDQPLMPREKRANPVTAYYPAAPALQDAKPVRVAAAREVIGIDVTLTPGLPVPDPAAPPPPPRPDRNGTGKIGGVVTDAVSGKPVAGVQILLLPAEGQGQRLTDWTRSDARGRFQYASLPAQRYTLRFQARRYITLDYGQTRADQAGKEIQLGDGEDFHADMKLPRTGAVEGTLLDEFGDPAPSVSLQLAQRQYAAGRIRLMPATGRVSSAPTDDRGHYRVANVAPGDYYVTALSGVYTGVNEVGGFAPTYYPGTIDAGGATPVTVPFGADAAAITFALTPVKTLSVSGTMVDADGKPVGRGATLWLTTPDRLRRPDFNIARGTTAPDGTFALRNVPQGVYTLQGFAPPAPDYRGPMNLGAFPFGSLAVSVGDSDLDSLVLKTTPGTTLTGKITFEDATVPLPKPGQVFVQTIPVEFDSAPVAGGPSPSTTHDDWTFEVTHQSGVRRILAGVQSPQWALRRIVVNEQDVTDTPVDFRTENVAGVEIVLTSKVSRVSGGVSDDKGPVADYVVVIFASDPTKWTDRSRFVAVARPTQQGRFLLAGLPPEDYLAIALPNVNAQEFMDPDFLQQLRAQATSFTLNDGESKGLELKLKRHP